MSLSKSIWGFDPRSIPGCSLWLDAADTSTFEFSTGSNVSGWRDKSGNGNIATVSSGANAPTRVGNSVQCRAASSQSLTISAGFGTSLTNQTLIIFFVGQRVTGSGFNAFLAGEATAGSQNMMAGFNNDNMVIDLYGPWFTASISTYSASAEPTRIYAYTLDTSAAELIMDGTVLQSTAGTYRLTAFQGPQIGRRYIGAPMVYHSFNLSEVIAFAPIISVAQRQQIEGYLAWKWGLQGGIPTLVAPPAIPGLALWLDGSDPNGNGVIPSDGSAISTWVDKSGNGNSLTSVGTPAPTYTAATKNITYGGNSYFQKTNFAFSEYTLFAVARKTSGNGPLYTNTTTTGISGFFQRYSLNGNYYLVRKDTEPDGWAFAASPFADGTTYMYSINYAANSNVNVWANGALAITTTQLGTITRDSILLGKRGNDTFVGTFSEVIQFNGPISTVQRQQIEGYLATKWGLKSSLPTTHPYNTSTALTTTHPFRLIRPFSRIFQPTDIPGCALWLDAADASTFTFSTAPNISIWRDKSGIGNNFTNSGTVTYGENAVTFNGTSMTNASFSGLVTGNASSVTAIVIFNVSSIASVNGIFGYGTVGPNNQAFVMYTDTDGKLYGTSFYGNFGINSAVSVGARYIAVDNANYSGTAGNFTRNGWLNGTPYTTTGTTTTTLNIASTTVSIGDIGTGQKLYGNIYEVLYYTGSLTAVQRQQIEGYLAWKWGLRNTVTSIAPIGIVPSSISGLALWLDAADASTFEFSTAPNISKWKDKSSNAFVGNAVNSPVLTQSSINGLPAVVLNGSSQYINFGNVLNLGTSSIYTFAVCKYDTTGDGAIVGKTSYRGNTGRWGAYRYASDGGQTFYIQQTDNASGIVRFANTSTSTQLLGGYWDRSNVFIHQNGLQQAMTAAANTSSISNTDQLLVGAYGDSTGTGPQSGFFFPGKICEIVVYLGSLTVAQRQQIETYLSTKWGIPLSSVPTSSFPVTHPFSRLPTTTYLPPLFSDVTPGRWNVDFSRELISLSNANASATRSFSTFTGASGYYGSVLAPNGNIYCASISSGRIGVIVPSNTAPFGSWSTIGSGLGSYYGGVLAPNGLIYFTPNGAGTIIVLTPSDTSPFGTISTLGTGLASYTGAVVGPDGKIYCVPEINTTTILVITPSLTSPFGTLTTISRTGTSGFFGGVLGRNGNIYCVPSGETNVGIVSPYSQTYRTGASTTTRYQSGLLGTNGNIYMFGTGGVVDILNTDSNTITTGATSAGNNYKSGCYGPDGKMYMNPIVSSNIAVYDPGANTTNTIYNVGGAYQYMGPVLSSNGRIYFTPWSTSSVLVISFSGLRSLPSAGLCLSAFLNKL